MLTDIINKLNDDQYNGFLAEAEESGILDASEFSDRTNLISALPTFEEAQKKSILDNIGKETIIWKDWLVDLSDLTQRFLA